MTNALTKTQVKKLMAAVGIVPLRVCGAGLNWEVKLADDKAVRAFRKHVTKNVGGYTTGCGEVVLRVGYQNKGDFNDKSSAHHY